MVSIAATQLGQVVDIAPPADSANGRMRIHRSMRRPAAKIASHDEVQERAQRGTRQLLLSRSCFFACGYVVTLILARGLGPTEYGIYGVVISQLLWLEMLMNA